MSRSIEAAAARAAMTLLGRLGPAAASGLGGAVARTLGPLLPVSRVAAANLALAFPEADADWRARVVRGAWDNLGRTAAEFPHVGRLCRTVRGPGFELTGEEYVPRSGPAVLVSGHLGNWEVPSRVAALIGLRFATLYRAAGNPAVDALIVGSRNAANLGAPSFAKGAAGARAALAWLRDGGALAMLVDQKMNDGIPARLFGRTAMTASAAAALALRFRCPVVPVRAIRLGPARVRVAVEPPLPLPDTGDRHADVATLTQAMNDRLEAWIREHPEQWLWQHRRWPAPPRPS